MVGKLGTTGKCDGNFNIVETRRENEYKWDTWRRKFFSATIGNSEGRRLTVRRNNSF